MSLDDGGFIFNLQIRVYGDLSNWYSTRACTHTLQAFAFAREALLAIAIVY